MIGLDLSASVNSAIISTNNHRVLLSSKPNLRFNPGKKVFIVLWLFQKDSGCLHQPFLYSFMVILIVSGWSQKDMISGQLQLVLVRFWLIVDGFWVVLDASGGVADGFRWLWMVSGGCRWFPVVSGGLLFQ